MSNRRDKTAGKLADQMPWPPQGVTSVPNSILVKDGAGRVQASGGHLSVLALGATGMGQGYEAWSGGTCLGLLRQIQAEPVSLDRINRIQNGLFADVDIFWTSDDKSGDTKIARNFAEDWTLAGHGTGFIQVTRPGAAGCRRELCGNWLSGVSPAGW